MNPWLVAFIVAAVAVGAAVVVRARMFRSNPVVRPAPAEVGTAQLAALEAFGPLTIGERLKIRLFVRSGKRLPDRRLVPAAAAHARKAILNERVRLTKVQWLQILGPSLLAASVMLSTDFTMEAWNTWLLFCWLGLVAGTLSPGRGLLRRYERALVLNEVPETEADIRGVINDDPAATA